MEYRRIFLRVVLYFDVPARHIVQRIFYIVRHIVQLVIVQYRARAHAVTLVVFFQVTEKG